MRCSTAESDSSGRDTSACGDNGVSANKKIVLFFVFFFQIKN